MIDRTAVFVDLGPGVHVRLVPNLNQVEFFTPRDCSEGVIEPQHIYLHGEEKLRALADALAPWASAKPIVDAALYLVCSTEEEDVREESREGLTRLKAAMRSAMQ
jgi:hypothetical protein